MLSTEPKGLSVLASLDAWFERTKHAWIPTEADPLVHPFWVFITLLGALLGSNSNTLPDLSTALLSALSLNQGYRS